MSPSEYLKVDAIPNLTSISSSRSLAVTSEPDIYYGHEEISVMGARFVSEHPSFSAKFWYANFKITTLFACSESRSSNACDEAVQTLALSIAYSLHRTRLPHIVTLAALLFLDRLKTRFSAARGSSGHRLFIPAFMLAAKVICDDAYSNTSWVVVAQQIYPLSLINQMEREMCLYLEWDLNLIGSDLLEFDARLRREYGADGIARRSSSKIPIPSAPITPTLQYHPVAVIVPSFYGAERVIRARAKALAIHDECHQSLATFLPPQPRAPSTPFTTCPSQVDTADDSLSLVGFRRLQHNVAGAGTTIRNIDGRPGEG